MHSYGIPGGTLDGNTVGTVAAKRAAGRRGEQQCAALLARRFARDPSVWAFHDVNTPGMDANLDHVVVRGSTVVVIDAKVWKPGVYWTAAGQTRRGTTPVPHASTATFTATLAALRRATAGLDPAGVDVHGLLLAWPSTSGLLSLHLYRPDSGIVARKAGGGALRWLDTTLGTHTDRCDPLLRRIWQLTRNRDVTSQGR